MNEIERMKILVDKFFEDCDRFITRMKEYDRLEAEAQQKSIKQTLNDNLYGSNIHHAAQNHVEQR